MEKIKAFISDHFKELKKFWINQFTMSLFGIMITWPCLAYISSHEGTDAIAVIASCFCGGFFCFLVYDVFFQRGAADATKKERGLIDPSPFTGLTVAAVAYIPTFVFIVAANIFYAANIENGYGFCSVVVNMVIHAMYSGFIWFFNGTNSYLQPLLMFVTLVPTLFSCALGYYMGLSERTLRAFLGFKPRQNARNKK